jgi:hypothetical protein
MSTSNFQNAIPHDSTSYATQYEGGDVSLTEGESYPPLATYPPPSNIYSNSSTMEGQYYPIVDMYSPDPVDTLDSTMGRLEIGENHTHAHKPLYWRLNLHLGRMGLEKLSLNRHPSGRPHMEVIKSLKTRYPGEKIEIEGAIKDIEKG